MTTPVTGLVSDYLGKSAATKNPPTKDLDKDTFLKLLVAQLKYQDPSNPADSTQFLAQTAQFTTVEKLSDLEKTQQSLLTAQLQLTASNLVGKTISYTVPDTSKPVDKDGKAATTLLTGVVTAASFTGSTPTVKVGDKDVALSSITEIRNTAAPAGQRATPAKTGTTS
jgi:flagellar basal-body rod modification protein FlgD